MRCDDPKDAVLTIKHACGGQHENAVLKRENARLKQSLLAMTNGNPGELLFDAETPRDADDDTFQQPKRLATSEVHSYSCGRLSLEIELGLLTRRVERLTLCVLTAPG